MMTLGVFNIYGLTDQKTINLLHCRFINIKRLNALMKENRYNICYGN